MSTVARRLARQWCRRPRNRQQQQCLLLARRTDCSSSLAESCGGDSQRRSVSSTPTVHNTQRGSTSAPAASPAFDIADDDLEFDMDGFDEDDFDAPSSSFESLRDLDGLVINKLPEPDSELMQRMSKKEIVEYLRAVTGVDQDFTRSGQMPPKAGRQGSGTVILSDVAANSDNGDQIVHVDIASELASVWNDSDDGDGDLSELDEKLLAEKYGMTIQTDEELEAQYELEEQTRRPQGFGYSPVTHATAVQTSSTVLESGLQELDLVNVDARGTGFGGTPKRLRAKLPSVKEAGGPQKYSELLELSDEAKGQNAPIPSDTKEQKALKSIAEFVPAQRFMRRQMYKPQTLLQRKTSSRLQDLIEMAYDHPNVLGRGTGFSELETISPSGCPPQVEAVYVTPCLKEAHVFWSLPWDAPEPQSAGVDEIVERCQSLLEKSRRRLHARLSKAMKRKPPRFKFIYADPKEDEDFDAIQHALAMLEDEFEV